MSNRVPWSYHFGSWCVARQKKLRKSINRINIYFDTLIKDHGLVRMLYPNRFRVSNQVFRSGHPNPIAVARAGRKGIKTIINLRGQNDFSSNRLSTAACRKHGIKLIEFRARSAKPPSKEMIHAAKELFERIEYPLLLHCKSGADRAGLMSALYLIFHEKQSVVDARKQLHWRYGHFRMSRSGILDNFFDSYEKDNGDKPIDFLSWIDEKYDPEALKAAFKGHKLANKFVDMILRRE